MRLNPAAFRWPGVLPLCAAGLVAALGLAGSRGQEPASSVPKIIDFGEGEVRMPEAKAVKKEDETAKETEGSADGAAAEKEGEEKTVAPQMSRLFPIGRPFKGVRIPSYAGDTLNTVVNAEVMRRIDEELIDMEQLVITSFGGNDESDTKIYMDQAIYSMTTEKLTSETPTRIVQPKFDMRGDSAVFDSKTQIGHLTGNVVMKIYEVNQVFSGGLLGGPKSESPEEPEKKDQ